MQRFWLFNIAVCLAVLLAGAVLPEAGDPLYYTVEQQVTVYRQPDSTQPYLTLDFRTSVYLLEDRGEWCHIRTEGGAMGYVRASALSNVWLRVSKRQKLIYLYAGTELKGKVPADFGYNTFSDKVQRGSALQRDHWRTPEGTFYIVAKNPDSEFYKALVLNYPTNRDARRGYENGLITRAERDAILAAQRRGVMPPMDTDLGGWIEIHGEGTGGARNWTQGCVAVPNLYMNVLWQMVEVGTPVLIED